MCQAAGEWHLVGISSWRKGCSTVGQRPRLYDRVSVNSEWARKTVEHLEDDVDVKEIRRRNHQVGRRRLSDKRGRMLKKDDDAEDLDDVEQKTENATTEDVGADADVDVDEVARDSRTELPAKKLKREKTN